ncbi:TPA: hypothetical protein SMT55_000988 [Proteus mirabilis]|nr:hypothetical protein [Proteus mirabilis]HEK2723396.1 hypothetical protein [Proteus mirabilis]
MFSESRTRITLLAVIFLVSLTLLFFEPFSDGSGRVRTRSYTPEYPVTDIKIKQLTGFASGVLLTGERDAIRLDVIGCGRETQRCQYSKNIVFNPAEDNAIPLLNLQISPDKQVIKDYLEQQTFSLRLSEIYFDSPVALVSEIFTEQDGQLQLSARVLGNVTSQSCDKEGHCLLTLRDYKSNGYSFYSRDGGKRWQWLSEWKDLSVAWDLKLSAVTGPGCFLIVKGDELYQSCDYGKNWKFLFSMSARQQRTKFEHSDISYTDNPTNWHYTADGMVFSWLQDKKNDKENTILVCYDPGKQKIISDTLIPGEITSVASTTTGEFYFAMTENKRRRQSINAMKCNGEYTPVLETGNSMIDTVYAGDNLILATLWKSTRVSVDNGKTWITMEALPDRYTETVLFDEGHNRLFYFPRNVSQKGNKSGLAYETSGVLP